MDKAREAKRKKVLLQAEQEKEVRLKRKQIEIQRRIREEILREERREKLKHVRFLQEEEVCFFYLKNANNGRSGPEIIIDIFQLCRRETQYNKK